MVYVDHHPTGTVHDIHISQGRSWFSNKIEKAFNMHCCKFFLLPIDCYNNDCIGGTFNHSESTLQSMIIEYTIQWVTWCCNWQIVRHNNRIKPTFAWRSKKVERFFFIWLFCCADVYRIFFSWSAQNVTINLKHNSFNFTFIFFRFFFSILKNI